MTYLNALVQGILLGGLYALLATGLSLTFGVMRLVNLAHGDLAVLGAFFCVSVSDALGWNPLVSLVIVLPAAFALGFVLDKAIFDRIVGVDPAYQIVATFGLAVVIQNLLLERYTANQRRLDVGAIEQKSIRISDDIAIGWIPLITLPRRRRRPGGPLALPPPHPDRPGLPGHLRRHRGGPAHGHRQQAHLRHRPSASPWPRRRWPGCSSASRPSSTRPAARSG